MAGLAGCRPHAAGQVDLTSDDDLTPEKKWGEPGYDDDKLVVVQVCLPSRRVEFDTLPVDLAYLDAARQWDRYHVIPDLTPAQSAEVDKTARKPRLSDGADGIRLLNMPSIAIQRHGNIVGEGPTGLELRDSTPLGQPVFETRQLHPEHYLAIEVRTMPAQAGMSNWPGFWFSVPLTVGDTWTAWSLPQAEYAGDSTLQVLRNRGITPTPIVSVDAPRMRFRLASNREWKDARRRWYPAVMSAMQQIQPEPPASGPRVRLLPQSAEVIPDCSPTR